MVNNSSARLDATFGALADPTRRAILSRLAAGAATVGDLAAPFDVSLPAISKHLSVLERANLIRREKNGRIRRVTLQPESMRAASAWIDRIEGLWEEQFANLARFLETAAQQTTEENPRP